MDLLVKTRKLNKLLQKGTNDTLEGIINQLHNVINANIFFIDAKGNTGCISLLDDFDCKINSNFEFPEFYLDYIADIWEVAANVAHTEQETFLKIGQRCLFENKKSTILPIYGKGERLGTLVVVKDENLSTDDLILCEYASTILGVKILFAREVEAQEATRKKLMVQIAFSTLSYSELEAIVNILNELDGNEGLLIASKIADRVGITRSVIVNALRKFESADLIETRSLGMKGTYIKVKNEYLFEELKRV